MRIFPLLVSVLLLTTLCQPVLAQRVLIAEEVPPEHEIPSFGPNRSHFHHFYSGFGFVTNMGADPGARILGGRSWEYYYGIRYKRRLNQMFSVGGEAYLSRLSYFPLQSDQKQVPDTFLHDREKFVILQPGIALYKRINYDLNRGNYIGRFTDVGIWTQWHGNFRHITRNTVDGETTRTRTSGMDYHRAYAWGILARVGFRNLVFKANYRLSDIFLEEKGIPELPRLTLGVEFGVHPL